jgi:hypothetical protein
MDFKNLFIFCVSLLVPFMFFRTVIYIISRPLNEQNPYTREGLKFHHSHYGLMLLTVGLVGFLTIGVVPFSIILAGLGLGTILDEFFPSLYLPEPEPVVTAIYRKSFLPTLYILGIIVLAILLLGAALSYVYQLHQ